VALMEKWKELIKEHGEIKTLICETVGGGYHYYFNYNGLPSAMNIGGYEIDILSDNYLVAAPPSIRKGKQCKYINNNKIIDMLEWLVEFIIMHSKKEIKKKQKKGDKTTVNRSINSELVYPIDDADFKYILDKLTKYRDDRNPWLKVLAAAKNSEK
jgi:hypothetical protein